MSSVKKKKLALFHNEHSQRSTADFTKPTVKLLLAKCIFYNLHQGAVQPIKLQEPAEFVCLTNNCPHPTVRIQETPASIVKEPLSIICNRLHDLCPVQTLNTLCIADIT